METPRAGTVYEANIEDHTTTRGNALGAARAVVAAVAGLVGDATGLSVGDLVVRRIDDGSEAMRIDAGTGEESAILLTSVRDQLAELDVGAFEDAWTLVEAPEPGTTPG